MRTPTTRVDRSFARRPTHGGPLTTVMSTSFDVIGAMPSATTVAVLGSSSGRDVVSKGMTALTTIDAIAPAESDGRVAVRKSPEPSDVVKTLLDALQKRRSAAGS